MEDTTSHPPPTLHLHRWTYWFLCVLPGQRQNENVLAPGGEEGRVRYLRGRTITGRSPDDRLQPPPGRQGALRWPSHYFICSRISPYWGFPCRGKITLEKKKPKGNPRYIYYLHIVTAKKKKIIKSRSVFVWRTFLSWEWKLFTDKFLFFVLSILRFVSCVWKSMMC